jgi:GDP-L-fucose synthase
MAASQADHGRNRLMPALEPSSRVFVAGHRGLVGSAIVRRLRGDGFSRILLAARTELDLRDALSVQRWFEANRPEYVFMAAGTVGGITANISRPAEFLYDNLAMAASVTQSSHATGVTKLLYVSSGCIYPREAEQPIPEESVLTGPLEPTNEAFGIAKIAGMKLCEFYRAQYGSNFIAVVPASVYGPGDDFDSDDSHVVAALIKRFHQAKLENIGDVTVWGTGRARRQFVHADDLADACLLLMREYNAAPAVNAAPSGDLTIGELAGMVRDVVHPGARLIFDRARPDGMPARQLDVSRLYGLGWQPRIDLRAGLISTYEWFLAHNEKARFA